MAGIPTIKSGWFIIDIPTVVSWDDDMSMSNIYEEKTCSKPLSSLGCTSPKLPDLVNVYHNELEHHHSFTREFSRTSYGHSFNGKLLVYHRVKNRNLLIHQFRPQVPCVVLSPKCATPTMVDHVFVWSIFTRIFACLVQGRVFVDVSGLSDINPPRIPMKSTSGELPILTLKTSESDSWVRIISPFSLWTSFAENPGANSKSRRCTALASNFGAQGLGQVELS